MPEVDSSQIKEFSYEPRGGILEIQFHWNGARYVFTGVPPEVHKEFLNASSKGKFFHQYIKRNFNCKRISTDANK